jgi:sulfite reductase (NADPH) hemoprotein beta-component
MVGGGVDQRGARFARLAAKVPARRAPAAIERLIELFAAERRAEETAAAFFARVDVARVKAALADLEALGEDTARPEDFVDLGEDRDYQPETQEGECAA